MFEVNRSIFTRFIYAPAEERLTDIRFAFKNIINVLSFRYCCLKINRFKAMDIFIRNYYCKLLLNFQHFVANCQRDGPTYQPKSLLHSEKL